MLSCDYMLTLYTDVQYSDTSFSGHVYMCMGICSLAVIVTYYAHDFEGYTIAGLCIAIVLLLSIIVTETIIII